jgi:hypothetical protein
MDIEESIIFHQILDTYLYDDILTFQQRESAVWTPKNSLNERAINIPLHERKNEVSESRMKSN